MSKLNLLFLMALIGLSSCNKSGCKDPRAINYDPDANEYGECYYQIDSTIPTGTATINIIFKAEVDGQDFYLNENYKSSDGRDYRVDFLKFYVSELTLANRGQNSMLVKDVDLIDYDTTKPINPDIPHWDNHTSGVIGAGTFNQLYIGLGVDVESNEQYSPNSYPSDHPLSTTYTEMGWGWRAKYKFMLFEGDVDSTLDGNYDRSFFYHTGFSDLYRVAIIDFDKEYTFSDDGEYTIELILDVNDIFGDLKFETQEEGVSHTTNATEKEISRIIQTNLGKAVTFGRIL